MVCMEARNGALNARIPGIEAQNGALNARIRECLDPGLPGSDAACSPSEGCLQVNRVDPSVRIYQAATRQNTRPEGQCP